ncbi:MAG: hypothetical protein U5K84_11320 [Alkalibacterium sp.]|nr:hypothetical protein [Alkalibacterium sp.]
MDRIDSSLVVYSSTRTMQRVPAIDFTAVSGDGTGNGLAVCLYLLSYRTTVTSLVLGLLLIALIIPVTVSDIAYQRIPNRLLLFFSPLFLVVPIHLIHLILSGIFFREPALPFCLFF